MQASPLGRPTWNQVVRALREARGINQQAWADLLGVGRRTVGYWESGELVPDRQAEEEIIAYCHGRQLFATADRRSAWGLAIDEPALRDLLAQARLAAVGLLPPEDRLWAVARPTHRLWPEVTGRATRGLASTRHQFAHKSRIRLALDVDRPQHLLLIEHDTEGVLYCLCPSWFAPETQLEAGINYLPQPQARDDAFVTHGPPGTERLLAIVTDEPLDLAWLTPDPAAPARVLEPPDLEMVLTMLAARPSESWSAWSAEFDIYA